MPYLDYYVDFRTLVDSVLNGVYGPFDSRGLPQVNYGGRIGVKRNPTTIAEFALGNYQYYGDDPKRNRRNLLLFNLSASWISSNYLRKNKKIYWLFDFDWPFERLKSPWYSGMTQGLCVSVLLRAYIETSNPLFADLAKGGFEVLNTEITGGGALFKEQSNFWIEEYPSLQPNHVLNGFVFAIFGLFDLFLVTKNREAERLLNDSLNTLGNHLESYDLAFWSSYDLRRRFPASLAYHDLHIHQLKSLYALSGKDIFLKYARKWKKYRQYPKNLLKSQLIYYSQSILNFRNILGLRNGFKGGTVALLQNFRKNAKAN